MATEIDSKTELASLVSSLEKKSFSFGSMVNNLNETLKGIRNYDGIDVESGANIISQNISNVKKDFNAVVTNIKNYVSELIDFDVDDFEDNSNNKEKMDYDDIFETDGTSFGNAKVIWNFLKYKGLSDAAVAGVLGNIQAESNFNPGIEEKSNGIGYGLIQWSFGRRDSLERSAKEAGVDPSNLQFQLEYLWNESLNPDTSYGKNLATAGFYTTTSASEAAYLFHKYVEISADSKEQIQNNRCATAEEWYQKFKGTDAGDIEFINDANLGVLTTSVVSSPLSNSIKSASYNNRDSSSYSGTISSSTSNNYSNNGLSMPLKNNGDNNIDISKYHSNLEMGFEVTVGNISYELSEVDIELLCAIVAAESDKTYDDALAVMTTILNRCESFGWINKYGTNPITQVTAPGQFSAYERGSYEIYMDGKVPDEVVVAVKDALAGVRNHEYLSFMSNNIILYSSNMITPTGNRYK